MDPKRKFFLFKQSKNFCAVPWNHFEVWSNGKIKTCSQGKSFGNINQQSLTEILNSDKIIDIKHALSTDQYHENCKTCHDLTTDGEHYDLRNHYNPMFTTENIDYNDLNFFKLNGIDLHWDNTCNFKCVYCNPQQSSLIAQEQGLPSSRVENENVDKIIDMIVENQYNMKEIYFSGGEPLLIKNNFKLLSKITNVDLPIRINSNISQARSDNKIIGELKRFKNVLWTVSAESSGAKFNYTRSNGDWEEFLNNLKYIKDLGHQVRINSVFFVGSAIDIFDIIEYVIVHHGIQDITINQLGDHPSLHVRNCPDFVKQQSREKLKKLLSSSLIKFQSNSYYNIARCEKELDLPAIDQLGYQQYFDQLDQLRNTNWRTVFPELVV